MLTTVSAPNPILHTWAASCSEQAIPFFVIGDAKTPEPFTLPHCHYFGLSAQQKLDFRLLKTLPQNHYSRKNLGYLLAIQDGCQTLLESDDDNLPLSTFWQRHPTSCRARYADGHQGWVNAYRHFSTESIWPRGFPPLLGHQPLPPTKIRQVDAPICQGLANGTPDVDAIFHLVKPETFFFEENTPFFVGKNQWCPFNSQATQWQREVFPLLYLPAYAPFRLTDIWRSLIAQRILWEYGQGVVFCSPTVRHERNPHNLLQDLEEELFGYLHHVKVAQRLENLSLLPEKAAIFDNLYRCYEAFVQEKWLPEAELIHLAHWIEDLKSVWNP